MYDICFMRIRLIKLFSLGIILFLLSNESWAQRLNCSIALGEVSTDSLVFHMKQLIGKNSVYVNGLEQKINSRYAFHSGNPIAAAFLSQKCTSYGFDVRNLDYSGSGRNVIAEKKGSLFPTKSIMLCAHYDCVGGTNSNFQGADDNASGCAALIEAARVLKDIDFPYTIQLAFWDEEEAGLLGSKAFPSSGGGLPEIITVVNLDMIGWDGNNDSIAMLHVSPNLPKSIEFANRMHYMIGKHNLPLKSIIKNPGEPNTDHQSFWIKEVPAIGLTEDYDNDLSPHWHKFSDSIDNIHIPYFVNMSKLAIMTLCEFAQEGINAINDDIKPLELNFFPNPAQQQFCIENLENGKEILILNSLGQKMLQIDLSNGKTNCFEAPKISGIYFVKIIDLNQRVYLKKLVVE